MRLIAILLTVSLWSAAANAAQPAEHGAQLQDGMVNPGYQEKPAWFKASFLDIREDIAEATADGKRLLLYFYQDGCPYCAKLLKDNFGNRAIAEKTQQSFEVIAINMWGDREVTDIQGSRTTEKAFAAALRVQYTPTLLFMDENGAVVVRINGYFAPHKFDVALDFVSGKHEKQKSFREFYAAAAPVAANTGLNTLTGALPQPLRLARREHSGRPLLVMFEQGNCALCDELHRDILIRSELAYALANVDLAQVDIWSSEQLQTPDGQMMTRHATGRMSWMPNTRPAWYFSTRRAGRCFAPRPICAASTSMARSTMSSRAPIAGSHRSSVFCSIAPRC